MVEATNAFVANGAPAVDSGDDCQSAKSPRFHQNIARIQTAEELFRKT
jgi:hypothetical protein